MSKINIKPLADRVLVQPSEAETTTSSGIIIPDTAKEKPQRGKIVAAGPGTKDNPQTEAIEDDPLDSVISETTRIVYGKSVAAGSTAWSARHANLPWPISLLPVGPTLPTSPTEYGGKL